MKKNNIIYRTGLPEQYRADAASLYDEAFGQKLSVAIRCDNKRLQLLSRCFMAEYAIVALSENKLVGIAGFHTHDGSLTAGITYKELLSQLGFIQGNWAALILSLYQRKPAPGELLMDGIAVKAEARGKGIGSQLLEEIASYAKKQQFNHVRLDVIDINSEAKKLYQRKGYIAVKTEYFPYLRWLLGFSGSTTMELKLQENG